MGPYTIRLDEIQAKDAKLVGEKGSNLAQMWAAGLPAPVGFCVTVDACEKHFAASDLWPQVQKHLANASLTDPAKVQSLSDLVQNLVLQAPMPDSVMEAIEAASQNLFKVLGSPLTPLAVRPSSMMKGLPAASFGRQHDAFLNVIGLETLLESIKKCWASLWTTRAILFRTQNSLSHTAARMAVVVHELVSATVSGTVFTANPITGEAEEVIIDAVWGLSEAIISELVAPDNYVVRKTDLAVIDRWVSTKRVRLMPLSDGGTEVQKVPAGRQKEPCLADEEIKTLVKLCLRVENIFKESVDIEFAWHHDHLYLLQCRPIAAIFGLPAASLEEELALRLKKVPLLAPLDDREIEQVARWARLQHTPANSVIIQQGEPGSDFYILASGRVALKVEVARGRHRFLGYRGAGFFFGETALLTDARRNATITAMEPSEVFVFDKESFDRLLELHPRVEEEIRLRMEARLRLTRILTAGI